MSEPETVGPLEQKVLEILCGRFNKGPWPPSHRAWAKASRAMVGAGAGDVGAELSDEETNLLTDDDLVDLFAGLARKHDEKSWAIS